MLSAEIITDGHRPRGWIPGPPPISSSGPFPPASPVPVAAPRRVRIAGRSGRGGSRFRRPGRGGHCHALGFLLAQPVHAGQGATAALGREMAVLGLEGPADHRRQDGDRPAGRDVEVEPGRGRAAPRGAPLRRRVLAGGDRAGQGVGAGGRGPDDRRRRRRQGPPHRAEAAADLGLPVVNCPTVASSDAPSTSPVSGVVGPTPAGGKNGDSLGCTTSAVIRSCVPIQTTRWRFGLVADFLRWPVDTKSDMQDHDV